MILSALSSHAHLIHAFPPTGLVLLAILVIQLGAVIATNLFATLGADGTVAIRVLISAILLVFIAKVGLSTCWSVFRGHWKILIPYGVCMAVMNLFFYLAIARIPLGAAVTFEFVGPLCVAAFTSRRFHQFAWVFLAAIGIVLLSPLSGSDLDITGVVFALLAGTGWALFILLSRNVGQRIEGNTGLTLGMLIAALTLLPLAVPVLPTLLFNPLVLVLAFGVAVLSTALPFTLEFEALKKLPARNYGILVSLEPAVATLVGAAFLGERLGLKGLIAIACVVIASVGITLGDRQQMK